MASIEVGDLKLAFSLLDKPELKALKAAVKGKINDTTKTLQQIRNLEQRGIYKGDAQEDEEEAKNWLEALEELNNVLEQVK